MISKDSFLEPKITEKTLERQEKYKPISYSFESEIGTFNILEDDKGIVAFEVENKEGRKVRLNDLLPEGYEIIGNKMLWEDKEYYGLYGTDCSMVDRRNKKIIVSEAELRKTGWRYLLVLFHEMGHIARAEQYPEELEEIDSLYNSPYRKDPKLLRRIDELTGRDERDAWAFAMRQFRKLTKDLGLPRKYFFENVSAFKNFVNEYLRLKIKSSQPLIEEFNISEEEKAKLLDEIAGFYLKTAK